MNNETLKTLANIESTLRRDVVSLYNEYLDLLNINDDERQKIEDAIIVTIEKLDLVRASKISNLDEHVEIEYLTRVFE